MILFKNVTVSFDDNKVLNNFSAELPDRGLVLITGKSGGGKTTLLRLLLGLSKPDSGEVLTEGINRFSVVFQEDRLVPTLTALENVALVSSKEEAEKRLAEVGLSDSTALLPEELSGGMKRRVALARALAFSGDVLILDEAFTGLEEALCKELIGKIFTEYKDRLIIAVTHRPELFADYYYTEIKISKREVYDLSLLTCVADTY